MLLHNMGNTDRGRRNCCTTTLVAWPHSLALFLCRKQSNIRIYCIDMAFVAIGTKKWSTLLNVWYAWNPEKEAVEIGFVARKGQTSQGAPSASQEGQPTYTVGLPRDMKLNALECNRITKDLDLFESVQGGEAMSPRDGGIALEYLPIEFTNMRFYNAYASNFAIFSIR